MGNESAYLKRLKERIRQNPDSKLFLSLAEELRKEGRTDEATAMLVDGIRRNPEFAAARLTLGRWYLSGGMFEEAKIEFSELIEHYPGNAFAHKGLAEAYRNLGFEENAVEEYRKVLAINPFDEETVSYLEAAGYSTEVVEEPAAEVLEPESAAGPVAEDIHASPEAAAPAADLSKAEALIAGGQYAKALEVLNAMLSSGPADPRIRQQKEELVSLIKLLRKDKDFVIARLNKFSLLITEGFAARRERNRKTAVNRLVVLLDSVKDRFARKYTDSLPEGS